MLWKIYQEKADLSGKRCDWVKELNVLDAMGGLLGDQIRQLLLEGSELLILMACMHDLGILYTDEERQQWYEDEEECWEFLRDYCP